MDKMTDDRTLTEANAYKRLYPVEYLRRFVSEDVRPDGREKDQWRDVRINVGMFLPWEWDTRISQRNNPSYRRRVHRQWIRVGEIGRHDDCLWYQGRGGGTGLEDAKSRMDRFVEAGPVHTTEPHLARSTRILVPNLDLPAISSPLFKPGPPAEEAQVFSQQLNDLLVSYVSYPSPFGGC